MTTTLAEMLAPQRVEFEELHQRYAPVLRMVNILIGVVPNCDRYLEIWQPGFRTYNLMVPNFLNLPNMLIGRGAPKDIVGLGMYAASRAASCAYCSAHTCSFALRRGLSADAVTGKAHTPLETATVAVAQALSTMPHHYDPRLGEALRVQVSSADHEWIILGISMMGFLNKFMDALGVELEPEAISDVDWLISETGWSVGQHGRLNSATESNSSKSANKDGPPKDSIMTLAAVARNAPGALKLDRQWHEGIPKQPVQMRRLLVDKYGFDEPLLTSLQHQRPCRALTAMLHHNLDPNQSVLGIFNKALVGLVFAQHAQNSHLIDQSIALALHNESADEVNNANALMDALRRGERVEETELIANPATRAALRLARAISPSPAEVEEPTINCVRAVLTGAQIVEIVVWVSVCQLIHRLNTYFSDVVVDNDIAHTFALSS